MSGSDRLIMLSKCLVLLFLCLGGLEEGRIS